MHVVCLPPGLPVKWIVLCCVLIVSLSLFAQDAPRSSFDPQTAFAAFDYGQAINRYRAANGLPGPAYWQNRADYRIEAQLDPQHRTIAGKVTITYTNHSPQALKVLWLHLEQNRYRADARGNMLTDRVPQGHTDGMVIDALHVTGANGEVAAKYLVNDTRMRVELPDPLAAQGDVVSLDIRYHFTIPGSFGGRTGWYESTNGTVFEVAQWYPRMAVFDDLRGWNTEPYLGNEFYLEYGTFDYAITVPTGTIVAGSGELMNPDEVLTDSQRERLEKARHSDKTLMIRTSAEVKAAAAKPSQGTRTWRFHMENTRDVAFAASRGYVWDAARINLPSGRSALAMSLYPPESASEGDWERSTEYIKASVEYFSRQWFEYPWPYAIAEAGKVGGMEYPGIVFDWWKGKGKSFYAFTAHEIGHNWLPMIVGSNETRHAWMDEGLNTFMDVYAQQAFHGGEFAPKRDSEYAPDGGSPVTEILPLLADPQAPPIATRADLISSHYRHPVSYFKAALGLVLLRDVILGPERFDPAFRTFIHAWAFKHPAPADFFRTMESIGGEDLSWFWRGWFRHNWRFDMAIERIAYVDGDPAKGGLITVVNLDKLVLPNTVRIKYADGHAVQLPIPVETWMQRSSAVLPVPAGSIGSATLDPEHVLPDRNRDNDHVSAR